MSGASLLKKIQQGEVLTKGQQWLLPILLSLPAMLGQISTIVMEYVDASMVGRLDGQGLASAAVGLMASSIWLFGGIIIAVTAGFTIQVAQALGGGKEKEARSLMWHALIISTLVALCLAGLGVGLSYRLPAWLGGSEEICKMSSRYFFFYALSLPFVQLNSITAGILQANGNMKAPAYLHIAMCCINVVLNLFLIFPNGFVVWGKWALPGAGMGVGGAALASGLSEFLVACILLPILLCSQTFRPRKGEKFAWNKSYMTRAVRLATPVGAEQVVMCGAQIMITGIVAPLGTVAISANSLSITAESLCYMPGFGISSAASTLVGQSIGANRPDVARKLGWKCTFLGMMVMSFTGLLLYIFAPYMLALLTPVKEIQSLGVEVLRIEAFAEPFFAAAIVSTGALRGAGDTVFPSVFNFVSMWCVRVPMAALLAPTVGLHGVWIAMACELTVRGLLYLWRLSGKKWHLRKIEIES